MEIYEYYVPLRNIIIPFLVWVGVSAKEETNKFVTMTIHIIYLLRALEIK